MFASRVARQVSRHVPKVRCQTIASAPALTQQATNINHKTTPSMIQSRNQHTLSSVMSLVTKSKSYSNTNAQSKANAKSTSLNAKLLAAACCACISGVLFVLQSTSSSRSVHTAASSTTPPEGTGLSPKEFRQFRLTKIKPHNHNTNIYEFAIPSPDASQNPNSLPVSSCLIFKYTDEETGKPVIRPYTPILSSSLEKSSTLIFMIKHYDAGKMSQHLKHMKVGDQIEIKGPIPKLKYEPNMKKRIGMIAGGTGITPMAQVIEKIIENPNDKTHVDLVFANTSPQDVLMKNLLDSFAAHRPDQIKIHYVVDKAAPSDKWLGQTGYINDSLLKDKLPAPSNDTLIYVCGPPPFMKAMSGDKAEDKSQGEISSTSALGKLGFTKDQVYKF